MPNKGITSVVGFLKALEKYKSEPDEEVFVRGHADRAYTLLPSLFRDTNHESNEHLMFMELLASNPEEFYRDSTAFERLVRMQHYGLPTRLLDLSGNPLIALYFACSGAKDKDGEVIVVRAQREFVRFFDSPTVSLMSNMVRLDKSEKDTLDESLSVIDFNELPSVKKLCSLVSMERPQFTSTVYPMDLTKCLIVRPKLNNVRITAQSGAFVIFGRGQEFTDSPEVRLDRIRINKSAKPKILETLDLINIGERIVYPAIEQTANYYKKKYSS